MPSVLWRKETTNTLSTDANIDTFPCYASNDEKNIDVSKIRE